MRKRYLALGALFVTCAAWTAFAQSAPKNPVAVAFTCPDHDRDDAHEVAIIRESDAVTIQTISGGDPAAGPTGEVEIPLNVQPIAFGQYRVRVRAGAGGLWSDWSGPSELWERVPGRPGGVIVR